MRKDQINAAGMDIELFAEVFRCHSGALDMPAGEANTPGAGPVHLSRGIAMLPEREVLWRVFILRDLHLLPTMTARAQLLDRIARKSAVAGEAAHIVVDVAVRDIGQPFLDQLLNHRLHLWNVLGCFRIEMW